MAYPIYGSLEWVGLDAFGNIHIIIKKQSWYSINHVLRNLKNFEKKDIKLLIQTKGLKRHE